MGKTKLVYHMTGIAHFTRDLIACDMQYLKTGFYDSETKLLSTV